MVSSKVDLFASIQLRKFEAGWVFLEDLCSQFQYRIQTLVEKFAFQYQVSLTVCCFAPYESELFSVEKRIFVCGLELDTDIKELLVFWAFSLSF
jgi:hypothetical protein